MPDDLSINIDTKALDEALSALPVKVQAKILRPALQAAGDLIVDRVRALIQDKCPERTPDSNALPVGIVKEDIHAVVTVGQTSGANVKIGPSDIAGYVVRWQNNGYNLTTHGRKRARKVIKAIPGQHFLESGTDEGAQAAIDALMAGIADGLQAEGGPR
jgi:hypothetical protein